MVAHGAVLRKNFFPAGQVIAILNDYHQVGLEPVEVGLMDFAAKVSRDAGSITQQDFQKLREDGLSEAEILDVTLAAAARNFFARVLDALGVMLNEQLQESEPEIWELVMGGRKSGDCS